MREKLMSMKKDNLKQIGEFVRAGKWAEAEALVDQLLRHEEHINGSEDDIEVLRSYLALMQIAQDHLAVVLQTLETFDLKKGIVSDFLDGIAFACTIAAIQFCQPSNPNLAMAEKTCLRPSNSIEKLT